MLNADRQWSLTIELCVMKVLEFDFRNKRL